MIAQSESTLEFVDEKLTLVEKYNSAKTKITIKGNIIIEGLTSLQALNDANLAVKVYAIEEGEDAAKRIVPLDIDLVGDEMTLVFNSVLKGTYKFVIARTGWTPLTIENVFVGTNNEEMLIDLGVNGLDLGYIYMHWGDFNGDGYINDVDHQILACNFGYGEARCDFDGNGKVDN
ncbi:hypothetical protein, partial [Treponema sp. R6D11]